MAIMSVWTLHVPTPQDLTNGVSHNGRTRTPQHLTKLSIIHMAPQQQNWGMCKLQGAKLQGI